jgi:hypothetical protein
MALRLASRTVWCVRRAQGERACERARARTHWCAPCCYAKRCGGCEPDAYPSVSTESVSGCSQADRRQPRHSHVLQRNGTSAVNQRNGRSHRRVDDRDRCCDPQRGHVAGVVSAGAATWALARRSATRRSTPSRKSWRPTFAGTREPLAKATPNAASVTSSERRAAGDSARLVYRAASNAMRR